MLPFTGYSRLNKQANSPLSYPPSYRNPLPQSSPSQLSPFSKPSAQPYSSHSSSPTTPLSPIAPGAPAQSPSPAPLAAPASKTSYPLPSSSPKPLSSVPQSAPSSPNSFPRLHIKSLLLYPFPISHHRRLLSVL